MYQLKGNTVPSICSCAQRQATQCTHTHTHMNAHNNHAPHVPAQRKHGPFHSQLCTETGHSMHTHTHTHECTQKSRTSCTSSKETRSLPFAAVHRDRPLVLIRAHGPVLTNFCDAPCCSSAACSASSAAAAAAATAALRLSAWSHAF